MEDTYLPVSATLIIVKSRISEVSWLARIGAARNNEKVLLSVLECIASGMSENAAINHKLPSSRRTWAIKKLKKYRERGFEALIDCRAPREPIVSRNCRSVLEAARYANQNITVDEGLVILQTQKISQLPSESTIKRIFQQVDQRQRYQRKKQSTLEGRPTEVIEESHAGGELLLAADIETGGVGALTREVMRYAEEAKAEEQQPQEYVGDISHRDNKGRFTTTYNRKRKRRKGEKIAGYLRPACDKAEGRPTTWPRFVRERDKTVDAKLKALSLAPLLATGKGWSAMRSPDFESLSYLAGYAYMPSTLAKFVSAGAICGLGPRLLNVVGRHWHQVAQQRWEEQGAMAAFFVDNHAKEIWSSLYTMSGKVSHLNRVMPCITTTYVQTGAGTPLVISLQSGSAPLAPRLVELVHEAEQLTESTVKRAVVIDSEGSTFDILKAFDDEDRIIVTPLKPSRTGGLELRYGRGSYFRPFRDNDEIRVAQQVTLHHKSTGRSLDLGALVVRREHREDDVVLLTTGLRLGMNGRELAELYFLRWPLQENAFKDWSSSVQLNRHRGNCGQMVANVAVITELERLEARHRRDEQKLTELTEAHDHVAQEADRLARVQRKTERALAVRRRRLDERVARGSTSGKVFSRCAVEHQHAMVKAEAARSEAARAQQELAENRNGQILLQARVEKMESRQKKLEPQRMIRQLDVAQDAILTATKLTAAQLIAFVLREYLPSMNITANTFITRVLPTRGRREVYDGHEKIIFYANQRDPQVNAALQLACEILNDRGIVRDERGVKYAVLDQDAC